MTLAAASTPRNGANMAHLLGPVRGVRSCPACDEPFEPEAMARR